MIKKQYYEKFSKGNKEDQTDIPEDKREYQLGS